jgi:hypothetical protein
MYKRTTKDEFNLLGFYSGSWEVLTTENTRTDIKTRLKEYRENEPQTPYKVTKNRVKI